MNRADRWETVVSVALHCAVHGVNGGKPVGDASPYRIASNLAKLARIGRALHRLYEAECNGDISPSEEKRRYALEKQAVALGAEINVTVTTQRDPRGAPIKLWADKEDGRLLGVMGLS